MTLLKANCWGEECFAYACTCIQGLKSFWRTGKLTVSSGYASNSCLYCTKKKCSEDARTANLFQEVKQISQLFTHNINSKILSTVVWGISAGFFVKK